MHDRQMATYILWRSSFLLVQCELSALSCLDKAVATIRGCKLFEEFLVRPAEAVVYLITRSPERVSSGLGQLNQPQTRVICGASLELNIAVPLCRVVFTLVRLCLRFEELLSLQRGDGADLCVSYAKFAGVVQNGMYVQSGCGRFAAQFAQTLDELLLYIIGQVVLLAEEHDATLAN